MNLRKFIPIKRFRNPPPVVGVLRLDGVIGRMGPLRRGLSLAGQADVIERAFTLKHIEAVALVVNSPGGSPVQSALIAKRIRDLAEEHDIPVFAFAEDVAASGGYWLACAADEIFAQDSSIIGSIGVVSGGFGFPELMKRWGIERRVHTSGDKKAALDPFQAEKRADVKRLKVLQADIHDNFKHMVALRRGEKLKADDDVLYSGEFWTGRRALDLGLIDGIGEIRETMRERYGDDVKLKAIRDHKPWWRKSSGAGVATKAGWEPVDWAGGLLAAVEERLSWNRFGL
jgi:signal peptide peptidase SppA